MERISRTSWRRTSRAVAWLWACTAWFFLVSVAGADPVPEGKDRLDVDCRFNPKSVSHPEQEKTVWENVFLPDGDVFRPLLADPKQPQTFATIQQTQVLGRRMAGMVEVHRLGRIGRNLRPLEPS